MSDRKKKPAPARKKKTSAKATDLAAKKAPEVPAALPLPTSTADPGYQSWLESVVSFGNVAPEEVVKERKGGPVIDLTRSPNPPRVIPRIPFETENGVTEFLLENVDGVGIAATTREGIEDRRDAVLLGKAHEKAKVLAALGITQPIPADALSPAGQRADTIISLGDLRYQIGTHRPITVEDNEDSVLQAFLDAADHTLSKPQLILAAGFNHAVLVLGRLCTKYNAMFCRAISRPGKRGGGGYHVAIEARETL